MTFKPELIEDWLITLGDNGPMAKQVDPTSTACEAYIGEGALWICSDAEMNCHFVPLAVIDRLRELSP